MTGPGTRLPMFPLSTVLFPHSTMPLHVFEPRYKALMRDCLEGDPRFGVVLIERGSEVGGGDVRAALGTRGVITRAAELPDGRWVLEVQGESVVLIDEWLPDSPYPVALVHESESLPDQADPGDLLDEATQRVRRARGLLSEHGAGAPLEPGHPLDGGGDPTRAAWQICGVAPLTAYDAQRLLAADGPTGRLSLLIELMDDLEQDLRRMLTDP